MHTRQCLARAIISAVENLRDENNHMAEHDKSYIPALDHDFTMHAQNNDFYIVAMEYLADMPELCKCPRTSEEKPCTEGRHKSQCMGMTPPEGYFRCDDCRNAAEIVAVNLLSIHLGPMREVN